MSTAAILTGHRILHPLAGRYVENGWYEQAGRRVLVLQQHHSVAELTVGQWMDEFWTRLAGVVQELDHVVIYVGSHDAEPSIKMAKRLLTDPAGFVGQVKLVTCQHGIHWKKQLLQAILPAGIAMEVNNGEGAECRSGDLMMGQFYRTFLETGILPVEGS